MSVSYKKLWKILIDREMTKTQLIQQAKITTNAMAKMGKGEDVRVETLAKICSALGCSMDEIIEIIPDNNDPESKNADHLGEYSKAKAVNDD